MFLGLEKSSDSDVKPQNEVLTNAQMCEADRLTIEDGTPGYDLMTAAGQAVANIVHEYYPDYAVLVLCGPGNNGGDGFVAAMFLQDMGHEVTVMSLVPGRKFKGDAKKAYKDWNKHSEGKVLDFKARPDLPEKTVVVDAVFGTGLSKSLEAPVTDVFEAVKTSDWPVAAVDIPSGVNGDTGETDPHTLEAAQTVTFFRKKMGHVLMPGLSLCGNVSVHDIGIPEEVIEQTGYALLNNDVLLWQGKLPHPESKGHKYSRGHLVLLGGERMTGAARMASEAAMRAGAGLCTIVADEKAAEVYQKAAVHVMYEPLDGFMDFINHLDDDRRNVILMGPGAGLTDTQGLQDAILAALDTGKPLLLDADAISCFTSNPERLYGALHKKCVLTPHEGEFAKLFPELKGSRLEQAGKAAELVKAVVLLKGPDTIIAQAGKETVVNTHATPWLATAGSGDVLAGIIAGLMAQGMEAFDAACAGSWIHGEAGERKGPGLVAPDIIEEIPAVLRDLS